MPKKRKAPEIAKILKDIFNTDFYGKKKGRYRIEKAQLSILAGEKKINKAFVNDIRKELGSIGFVLVNIVDQYAVLEKDPLHRYRKVKKEIIKRYTRRTDQQKTKRRS